jgi:hypothetical protein
MATSAAGTPITITSNTVATAGLFMIAPRNERPERARAGAGGCV